MAAPGTLGDLTLAARVAAPETFAPFGRLLDAGDRVHLAQRGALLALDRAQPTARRVTHLVRYPDARRVVLPLGPGALLLVVLPPGERPGGPPAAFLIPAGQGVLIERGVWHAGPAPLSELPVAEVLETTGPVDRMDRRTLRDLVGAEGARVVLPEEPGARPPGFDLSQPNAVLVDAALGGRLRLACLEVRGLEGGESGADLNEELERLSEQLRAGFGVLGGLEDVPGVEATRAFFRTLSIDPAHVRPSSEALLAWVLEGRPPMRVNALVDAVTLCSLKMRVPVSVYDAERIAEHVLVRNGAPGESFPGVTRQRQSVEGRPVLCDREGPFGGPAGDSLRTRATTLTRRALIVLYLPPSVERPAAEGLLHAVAETVRRHAGGRESVAWVL